jgi:hypothetical protein
MATRKTSVQPDGFAAIVKAFARDRDVTPPGEGKGFGSRALKVKGKIFAMISSKAEFVVKLPRTRTAELIAAGHAKYFDAGRGKPMKEWAAIVGGERLWLPLAKEARDFVAADS